MCVEIAGFREGKKPHSKKMSAKQLCEASVNVASDYISKECEKQILRSVMRRMTEDDIEEQKRTAHIKMSAWTCLVDVVNAAQEINSAFEAEQIAFRLWEWDFPTPVDILFYNQTVGHISAIPEPRVWEVLRAKGAAEFVYRIGEFQCKILQKYHFYAIDLLNPFYPPLSIFSQQGINERIATVRSLFKGSFDIYPPTGATKLPERVQAFEKQKPSKLILSPDEYFEIAATAPKPTKLTDVDPTGRCIDVGRPSLCSWMRVQAYKKRFDGFDVRTAKVPNALASDRVHALRNDYNYRVYSYKRRAGRISHTPITNPRARPAYNYAVAQDELQRHPIAAIHCNADRSVRYVLKKDLFRADIPLAGLQTVTGHEGDAYPRHVVSPASFRSPNRGMCYSPHSPTTTPPRPTRPDPSPLSVELARDESDTESGASSSEMHVHFDDDSSQPCDAQDEEVSDILRLTYEELPPDRQYSVSDIVLGTGIPFTDDVSLSTAMRMLAAEFREPFSEIGFDLLNDTDKIERVGTSVVMGALEVASAKDYARQIQSDESLSDADKLVLTNMAHRRLGWCQVRHARYQGLLHRFSTTVPPLVQTDTEHDSD